MAERYTVYTTADFRQITELFDEVEISEMVVDGLGKRIFDRMGVKEKVGLSYIPFSSLNGEMELGRAEEIFNKLKRQGNWATIVNSEGNKLKDNSDEGRVYEIGV